MKKLVSLLLAVLLVLSAFAVAEVNKDDYTPFENTVIIRNGRGDGFSFYGNGDEEWTSPEDNKWLDMFKEYLNVEFDSVWLLTDDTDGSETRRQWDLAIVSGNIPMCGGVTTAQYEELLEAGLVADMTDIYEEYASDQVRALVEGSPEMEYQTRDGKLYGLPVVSPSYGKYEMVVIRKDWMDAVGVTEVPTTIDGLLELGQMFVDAKLGGENTYALCIGGANMSGGWGGIQGFMTGYDVAWVSNCWVIDEETNELYYGPTDEKVKDALLRLQDLYVNGLIREDYLVTTAKESFTAGEAGIIYSYNAGPVQAVDLYALDDKVDLFAADAPTLTGEKPIYYDAAVPTGAFIVSANTTEEERIAIMQGYNLTQALFEDKDYDWGYYRNASPLVGQCESAYQRVLYYEDIAYAYETGDLTQFKTANSKTYYERTVNFEAGDRTLGKYYPIYRVPNGTYGVMYRAYKEDRMKNTAYLGVPTETMNEKSAALDTLLINAANKVIMGADISVWEDAVAEWYTTGGQTITDEVNDWYQAQ